MTVSLKIAVVEDHIDLRNLFVDFLRANHHDVAGLDCADDLDDHLVGQSVDLLILDLNLPGEDGLSVAKRLRAAHPTMSILMITARIAVEDRIRGYASGADLYLCKPVSPQELGSAVASVARRIEFERERQPAFELDLRRLTLGFGDHSVDLGSADTLLLKHLAEAPHRKLEYWRIMELLSLETDVKGKSLLGVRISRLNRKIADAGLGESVIKALWKEGYQLRIAVRIVD